jgi:hypothetical protein
MTVLESERKDKWQWFYLSRQSSNPERLSLKGLTLVELLLVIGICFLLFAIMFLTGREVKHHIYITKCSSQMRQLHQAVLLYMQDHDNIFPAYLGDEIFPYVKNTAIFYCPIWYALAGEGKSFDELYKERLLWKKSSYAYVPHIVNQYYRMYKEQGPDPERSRHIIAPWEYYYSQIGDNIPLMYCQFHDRYGHHAFEVLLVRMNGQAQYIRVLTAKSEKEAKYPHEW